MTTSAFQTIIKVYGEACKSSATLQACMMAKTEKEEIRSHILSHCQMDTLPCGDSVAAEKKIDISSISFAWLTG